MLQMIKIGKRKSSGSDGIHPTVCDLYIKVIGSASI